MTALATLLPLLAPHDDFSLAMDRLAELDIATGASCLPRSHACADVDLLFSPPLPPHPSLPPDTLARLQELVTNHLGAHPSSGTYLLAQNRARKGKQPARYSTSLEDLDDLLDGGFDAGEVVELCGPRRSGRTVFALYVVLLHLLLHSDKRVAWLDTSGAFDAFRCLAILRDVLIPRLYALGGSFAGEDGTEPQPEELAIAVLDRLAVSRVGRSGDALDILTAETRATAKSETLDMVVIDTLDTLVGGQALANGSAQGHANLIAFMRRLGTLARASSLPLTILVITSAVPSSAPSRPPAPAAQPPALSSLPLATALAPALGSTFAYLTDLSLLLTPAEELFGPSAEGGARGVVEVVRNARGERGAMVLFRLAGGVKLEQLE
ncbi:hypothetical protein JCM3770_006977 [Rhodotorula araucariae]